MSGHWKLQTIKHEWLWPKFSLNGRTIVEDRKWRSLLFTEKHKVNV